MNYYAPPLDIHLPVTVTFLIFLHFWWGEVRQVLWPLALCVRRETCVSLWLLLRQTEEMYEIHCVRKQIEAATKSSFYPYLYSLPPTLTPHPTCYKKISHWKTLRSKLFWIIFVIDAGPAGVMGSQSNCERCQPCWITAQVHSQAVLLHFVDFWFET